MLHPDEIYIGALIKRTTGVSIYGGHLARIKSLTSSDFTAYYLTLKREIIYHRTDLSLFDTVEP